jgi:Cu2+-exporting ATPase
VSSLAQAAPLALIDQPRETARFTRLEAGSGLAESSLQLSGLHCAACAGQIEAALAALDGVVDARVHAAASRATVRWDPRRTRPSALVAAVQATGYGAAPDTAGAVRALRRTEERQWLWRFFVATFCAMQVMMLATPVYVAEAGTLAPDLELLLHRSAWTLTLPVLLFSAAPFFVSAWTTLRRGRLGMDVPVALGIAVAFVASSGAAFDPTGLFGHEVYFDSLTMFVSFLLGGRWLEARARHRSMDAIERLAFAAPRAAWRLTPDGRTQAVAADALSPGERVRVPVGEAFPADGCVEEGVTTADESLLTGESRPVDKGVGAHAVAGSLNLGAPVVLRVERVGADTRFEQIAALMREALTRRPEALHTADRLAGPFLAAVLVLAGVAAWWWWPTDPTQAVRVAVAVLIVTCPCALSLATPSALLAATSALARRGVLLRRVEALESLARVRHVMLDKTGTVTDTQPELRSVVACVSGLDDAAVEALADRAASLASVSTHPLSRALVAARPGAAPVAWRELRELPGLGLEAVDEAGLCWRLGAPRWWGAAEVGVASVCFGPPQRPHIALHFDETLRADAREAVQALQHEGLTVTLLSGDEPQRVLRLAERLGLGPGDAIAAATPERKLEALRAAQADGRAVAMVGDGVNDAPVLAQADVSFALAQGAQIARQAADAVLLSGRLGEVAHAVRLAHRTRRVMQQNLAWAAFYNAACVPLALVGWLPPWAAGLGMALSSLLVVGNSLRLARAAALPSADASPAS